jgi:hypothetical protein
MVLNTDENKTNKNDRKSKLDMNKVINDYIDYVISANNNL